MTLAELRRRLQEMQTRAAGLTAQITADTAEADVTRIEGEHRALLTEIEGVQRQIAEAETAESDANPPPPANAQQAAEAAIRAERTRVATLTDIGARAGLPATDVAAAIGSGEAIEAFRVRAFDALAARQVPTSSVQASITRDGRETLRRGMSDAIVARMARASGERNVQVPEHARAYGEMSFAEMAAEAIGHRGHLRTARQVIDVMERAFHSTSDFPAIFSDALNTRLLPRYEAATPAYRLFCARYLASDFRAQNVVRAGDFPVPQRLLETGEIPASTFGESKEQLQVYPYGVRLNLSRQMIINDNLGAIDQMLGSYSDTIVDWENALAFALLTSASHAGPTLLTDSLPVFHTSHGNHVTSGTAISIASVGLGSSAMMEQTSMSGLKLNIKPTIILTGSARKTEAEQLTAQITPAETGKVVPDWMRRLQAAADANIDGNHWYLFGDVSRYPCFHYGNLQGFEGPRLSARDPFTIQGIEMKVEHDFGLAGTDYRGAYHNAGAAPT